MSSKYTTIQGDTWDAIAHRLWNEERLFHHLLHANPAHRHVVFFDAGVELQVPALPEEVLHPATALPPWRRNERAS